jgi:hypothetical protein
MFSITYRYKCDICDKTTLMTFEYQNDRITLPIPKIPSGWYESPNGYICEEHNVVIDPEEIFNIGEKIYGK